MLDRVVTLAINRWAVQGIGAAMAAAAMDKEEDCSGNSDCGAQARELVHLRVSSARWQESTSFTDAPIDRRGRCQRRVPRRHSTLQFLFTDVLSVGYRRSTFEVLVSRSMTHDHGSLLRRLVASSGVAK